MASKPVIAVTADIRQFDNYLWHCVPDQYVKAALVGSGLTPLMVTNFGADLDFDAILDSVNGVLVTGSKTNVHPSLYGKEVTPDYEPFDPARDATTLPLIRAAIQRGVPLLAICRGIQELNVALGGSLATEIQTQDGKQDHRAPVSDRAEERFKIQHSIKIAEGSCLAEVFAASSIEVNSLHRQAIDQLAPNLMAEAVAADGTVEAVSVKGAEAFAVGVQWHPEFWVESDNPSKLIFSAFGKAVKKYAARS